MNDDTKEIVKAISALKESIDEYRVMSDRMTAIEDRMHDIENEFIKYRNFIEKTSGIFTRAGFYGDAAILWLKSKFKK